MCEHVCKGQGERVTNLRAAEKELRDENRRLVAEVERLTANHPERVYLLRAEKAEAERDRYKGALEEVCALVMVADVPIAWEARAIAQKALGIET